MSRALAVLVGVGAGGLVGMQAPINARLGKTLGGVQAATFSFLVGTAALGDGTRAVHARVRELVPPLLEDRGLGADVERVAEALDVFAALAP